MPIPVHIIGGFLGVGKTTALIRLVASRAETERAAVIVNDFGEAAIDAAVILTGGGQTGGAALKVENIPGGCVCCTAPEGLVRVLSELLDVEKPDRIYIEPSGLGRPRDVVDMLARGGVAARVDLRPIVVIVDPDRLDFTDALMQEQWEGGDVLVLNRLDLCPQDKLQAVRAAVLEKWPPFIEVVETSHGVLPGDLPDWQRSSSPEPALRPGHHGHPRGRDDDQGHDHGHGHDQGHGHDAEHDHHPGPGSDVAADSTVRFTSRSDSFSPGVPFRWDALRALLTSPRIERFKGMFWTDIGWLKVDVAGGRVDFRGTPWRRDSRYDVIVRADDAAFADQFASAISQALAPVASHDEPVVALVDPEGNSMELARASFSRLGAIDVAARLPGRVGTAVRLGDVLDLLSPAADARVVLCASDGMVAEPVLVSALSEVLLVYALEDGPLPAKQGGPFRVLVPEGTSPCASVKGLSRIRVL
ncbi:MAG: hypothetical protein EXR69_07405 [Myxococcales bacterium]|nr:hypothetical protein [Myxococcales bacterium]